MSYKNLTFEDVVWMNNSEKAYVNEQGMMVIAEERPSKMSSLR